MSDLANVVLMRVTLLELILFWKSFIIIRPDAVDVDFPAAAFDYSCDFRIVYVGAADNSYIVVAIAVAGP